MQFNIVVAIIALVASGAAMAQPAAKPVWQSLPTAEDVAAAMPAQAVAAGQGGLARLTCRVAVGGVLSECQVAGEEPAGLGFGGAALTLVPRIVMAETWADGRTAVGESITLPIRFTPPPLRQAQARARASDVALYYPDLASRQRISGLAVLACDLASNGMLSGCKIVQESPSGQDFGNAAMAMVRNRALGAEPRPGAAGTERVLVKLAFQSR